MPANTYSTNLGLSELPEIDQKKYPGIFQDLVRIRIAIRGLQSALDIYTGALPEDKQYWPSVGVTDYLRLQNISRIHCEVSEDISAGHAVTFFDFGGKLAAKRADSNTINNPCRGFCSAKGGVLAGSYGEFVLLGVNPFYSGLTPGQEYYLSLTPGLITSVMPTTMGNIQQKIGYALSSTALWFNPSITWDTV